MDKRSEKTHRKIINTSEITSATTDVVDKLYQRLNQKGFGTWLSRHEILGMIEEEKYELTMAVHNGDLKDVKRELLDIAVGSIFAVACIDAGGLDW